MWTELRFIEVDSLSFSVARQKLNRTVFESYTARQLGPLIKITHLSSSGLLPMLSTAQTITKPVSDLVNAIQTQVEFWSGPNKLEEVGLIRTEDPSESYEHRRVTFFLRAQTAGHRVTRLSKTVSKKLVAAMSELECNIYEHSNAHDTGLVAFRAELGAFEFFLADFGIGVLKSLHSNGAYLDVRDEGVALRVALTDGVSRFGKNCKRGFGFRTIFQGLVNHYGELRFRSGDHALSIQDECPELTKAQISQKPRLQGFLVSVRCTPPQSKWRSLTSTNSRSYQIHAI